MDAAILIAAVLFTFSGAGWTVYQLMKIATVILWRTFGSVTKDVK